MAGNNDRNIDPRSAIEIVVVAGINFALFSGDSGVAIEDAVGMALMASIAVFCCCARPPVRVLNSSLSSSCGSP
jgi:hypothetical protein